MGLATSDEERRLQRLVRSHDRWRGRSVFNLLPSENAVSPAARKLLASDLAGRYTLPQPARREHGAIVDNDYGGTRFTDEIERIANATAAELFHGRFATTRPLSGHIAAMSALAPLLPRAARFLALMPEHGGYDGYAPGFLPALLGYAVRPLPAPGLALPLDAEAVVEEIRRERPAAVVLGQSFFLFPYPLRPIAEAAHAHDALVLYDASHVLGLIAGGEFQDPLGEGADVVYGSTHKSFPGPQGGLLVTDREDLFQQLDPALTWRTLDNAHQNRIAGLAQTLLEMKRVGPEYARTVIANAQALARALDERGLPLLAKPFGFTRSHQVIFDKAALPTTHGITVGALSVRWEREGLIADRIGRLGTAEVTRLGLTPEEMPRLAELLVRAGVGREKIAKEVRAWRRSFSGLKFA
jgi:glycine hydroxymethyltransferase